MSACCGSAGAEEGTVLLGSADEVREAVRRRYAGAALAVASSGGGCGCGCGEADPVTGNLYADGEVEGLPGDAVLASLGCGNPTALAELREGEVVLDLGSGGGIDVLLSARRVGGSGKVYGLDMTDEMLELARRNQREAGVENVEFLKGQIENVPLPDASVDVIISNCVVNLSPDKDQVLREAFRVLRPGGRLAISDVVATGPLPESLRRSMASWSGCLGGALEIDDYRAKLRAAGFGEVDVEVTRAYDADVATSVDPAEAGGALADGTLGAAFIRATKPGPR